MHTTKNIFDILGIHLGSENLVRAGHEDGDAVGHELVASGVLMRSMTGMHTSISTPHNHQQEPHPRPSTPAVAVLPCTLTHDGCVYMVQADPVGGALFCASIALRLLVQLRSPAVV